MILFVGLGNPTPDNENNRHNIGFKVIDAINKNNADYCNPSCNCVGCKNVPGDADREKVVA